MYHNIKMVVLSLLILSTKEPKSAVEPQTTSNNPISYTIEAPKTVRIGEAFRITVVFNIKSGWFVYAPIAMNTNEGKIPTKVTFKVPDEFLVIDGLELPDKTLFFDTYRGQDVRMSQKFRADKNSPPGTYTIQSNIVYQTCNDNICYPPVRKKVDVEIEVVE